MSSAPFAMPTRTAPWVVYANTSAAVKSACRLVVTSSCALDIVQALKDQAKNTVGARQNTWAVYIKRETGADMVFWQGKLHRARRVQGFRVGALEKRAPGAKVLVHPSPRLRWWHWPMRWVRPRPFWRSARELDASTLIVATTTA